MPLPTLSRKIADLETQLKVRLLLRSTRRLSLTDAGADYLAAARHILEQVDEAERVAAGEWRQPRGELVVTAPVVFGRLHVLPAVTAFLANYPDVDVNLVLSDRNLGLLAEHVDIAVRIGALPDSDLVATTVGHVRRVIVAAPELLDRCGTPQRPDALQNLPCIAYAGLGEAPRWSFARPKGGPTLSVTIRPRLTVSTVEAGIDAAVAGVGFAQVLSYQSAAAEAAGALRRVLQTHEGMPLPVSLLHVGQGPLPLKTRTFLAFAATWLRSRGFA